MRGPAPPKRGVNLRVGEGRLEIMDQQTLLYIMTGFVALAALAMLAQAIAIVALYKGTKRTVQVIADPARGAGGPYAIVERFFDAAPRRGLFGLQGACGHPDAVHGVLTEVGSDG